MAYEESGPETTDGGRFPEIQRTLSRLLKESTEEKRQFEADFRECYRFMMPHRIPPMTEGSTRPQDANDNFTTLGEEVTTDFASDMADTFTPEHAQWAGVEVASAVPEELKAEVEEAAEADTNMIFDAITASNFHEACKQGNKDLAVSAFGLTIEDVGPGEAFHCQVIPLTELKILRGMRGGVGTRLWCRKMKVEQIVATFPMIQKADLPRKVREALSNDKNRHQKFEVVQGCYEDFSVPGERAWWNCTMIAGEVVDAVRRAGDGSANVLVCRWDPDPCFAWGIGPGMKCIADFRELDETAYLKMKSMARIIDPPFAYTDDQVMSFETGLSNGVAIPMLEGSEIHIIESQHGVDATMFALNDVTERVRRHFYLDKPEQPGRTPPTATQWMDEALRNQRRLGTPASPIWPEFLREAFLRFRYLLIQQGILQPKINVGGQFFPIRPMNPLKRAAQQEEYMASERVLTSMANLYGPELLAVTTDVGQTMHNLVSLAHAKGVKLKKVSEINATLAQMQQAQMAAQAAQAAGPIMAAAGGARGGA